MRQKISEFHKHPAACIDKAESDSLVIGGKPVMRRLQGDKPQWDDFMKGYCRPQRELTPWKASPVLSLNDSNHLRSVESGGHLTSLYGRDHLIKLFPRRSAQSSGRAGTKLECAVKAVDGSFLFYCLSFHGFTICKLSININRLFKQFCHGIVLWELAAA